MTSFYGVVLIGTDQVYLPTSVKEGLDMVLFLFNKGRASRLIRISLVRPTVDVTPDYVRNAYPHLFTTERV